jgi:hypothetical protein
LLFQAYDKHLEQLSAQAERVCRVLREAGIEYRIVGGLAVLFHVGSRDPLLARLTKDVDLAVNRVDLAGVDMLVDTKAPKARSGIHLLFAGEKVRPTDVAAVPELSEPTVNNEGMYLVAPAELVRMKLISFRLKDKTHIVDMDSVGLITPEIEAALPEVLRERLEKVRAEERGA